MINIKNNQKVYFGKNSITNIIKICNEKNKIKGKILFLIDYNLNGLTYLNKIISQINNSKIIYINTNKEPTNLLIDNLCNSIIQSEKKIKLIFGIGGGSTLDVAKAISIVLTNKDKTENFQGWDKVTKKPIFKIGIPTLAGTGSESTKTCVLINKSKNMKLGINSEFSIFNEIILDPLLLKTVSRDQYFFTGMDSYIHAFESNETIYQNSFSKHLSDLTIKLCNQIFNSHNMMSDKNLEKIMLASYFGGLSIAYSTVGVVHPFSAGLSVVFGTKHCLANCIVLNKLYDFYPKNHKVFNKFLKKQNISLPKNICKNLSKNKLSQLYEATIMHEKPLKNALGENYKKILSFSKVSEIFKRM